jgi:hypothetical protein
MRINFLVPPEREMPELPILENMSMLSLRIASIDMYRCIYILYCYAAVATLPPSSNDYILNNK